MATFRTYIYLHRVFTAGKQQFGFARGFARLAALESVRQKARLVGASPPPLTLPCIRRRGTRLLNDFNVCVHRPRP